MWMGSLRPSPAAPPAHVCSCTRPEASCGAAPRAHLGSPVSPRSLVPSLSPSAGSPQRGGGLSAENGPRLPSSLFASSILALPRPPTGPFLPAVADLLIHPPDQPRRRAGLVLTHVWCEPPAVALPALHVPPPRTRSHGHLVTERRPCPPLTVTVGGLGAPGSEPGHRRRKEATVHVPWFHLETTCENVAF